MKHCILDGRAIETSEQLHAVLQQELELPEWYGRNLDALYDSLTDSHERISIEIRNPEALAAHLGRYVKALEQVIRDAAEENAQIKIVE